MSFCLKVESSYSDYGDVYDYGVDGYDTTGEGGDSSSSTVTTGGGSTGGGGSVSVGGGSVSVGGGSVSVSGGSVSVGGGSASVGGSSTTGGGSSSTGTGTGGSISTGTGDDYYPDLDKFKEEDITDYGDLGNVDMYEEYDGKVLPAETDEYYGQVKKICQNIHTTMLNGNKTERFVLMQCVYV